MPPYRAPVVKKPKIKPRPVSGAAGAINAAVKTASRAAAKAPTPKARVRVKAKLSPRKAKQQTHTGKAIGATITRATAKATAPHKLTKPIKSEPGLGGLSRADLKKRNAVGYYDPHGAQGQEAGVDKAVHATASKILAQTTRLNHAEAGAVRAAVKGENIPKAALRGVENKDKYTFSDALDAVGVHNKIIKTAVGLGLDVALDPVTYATVGASVPAEVGARAAAKAAEKKALKAGLSGAPAKRFAGMAHRQASKDTTRGLKLGARGGIPFTDKRFDVKTSGKSTARIGRALKKSTVGKKVSQANAHVRSGLHESVAPDVTPAFRSRAEHETIRGAERRTRAKIATGEKRVIRRTKAYAAAEPELLAEALKNVDAIERKQIDTLPPAQQQVARSYKRDFAEQAVEKQQRGIGKQFTPEGPKDAQDYFPHELTPTEEKNLRATAKRKPGTDKHRRLRVPLVTAVKAKPGRYVEVPHVAYAAASQKTVRNTALADLWQHVATTGKTLRPGTLPGPDEAVYKVSGAGLEKIKPAAEGAALKDRANRYVILHEKSVDDVMQALPQRGKTKVGSAIDKTQGVTKKLQTIFNPAYQAKNLTGDSVMGWEADTNLKSFKQAGSGLRAENARNKFESSAEAVTTPGPLHAKATKLLAKPLDLKKSGKSTMGEELRLAEEHGAINAGQVQTDVRNLIGTPQQGKLWTVNEKRENFPRFATYLSARKRGMTPDAAAKYSLDRHIDYADLTEAEKVTARRAFQFYTFAARNTRIQAKTLLTRPGKFATVQKVLEESSKAAGFGTYADWLGQLPDYNQRGLPVPVKVGNQVFPIFAGLPQTDLSQLSLSGKEQAQNILNRVTFFKLLPELALNYSVFFQGPIQPPDHERTLAPRGIQHLLDHPATKGFAENVLNIGPYKDKKSGKTVWGWSRYADYVSRTLPQTNFGVSVTKPGQDDRSLNGVYSLVSLLTGVKIGPDKRADYKVSAGQEKLIGVQDRMSNIRDEKGLDGAHKDPEYRALLKTQRRLQVKVRRLKSKRGDHVLPKAGAPRKGRQNAGPKTVQQEIDDFHKESQKSVQDEINDFAQGR